MIVVYAFSTPNSIRVPIALEELGLEYELKSVKVRQPFTLTESAAILVYLAERTGRLIPESLEARARVFEQLFFKVSGIGPAFGQPGFFKRRASEQLPLVIARFDAEAKRTLAVLDSVLACRAYCSGEEYTIADIAHFGRLWRREFADVDFSTSPNVARWYENIAARAAVVRAIQKVTALVPSA